MKCTKHSLDSQTNFETHVTKLSGAHLTGLRVPYSIEIYDGLRLGQETLFEIIFFTPSVPGKF